MCAFWPPFVNYTPITMVFPDQLDRRIESQLMLCGDVHVCPSRRSGGRQVAELAPVRRATGHVVGSRLEVTAVVEGETIDANHPHFHQYRPDARAAGQAEMP